MKRLAIALIALAALAGPAAAMKPDNISDAEMALIPPYCPDANTFGYGGAEYNSSPNAPKWVAIMGKTFWAIHHYCWALINLSRVERTAVGPSVRDGSAAMIRRATREAAVDDLFFVVEHGSRDSVVMPEIFTKIGEVQLSLGRIREADEAYAEARSLRRDYWPAYYQWAEYLNRSGKKAEARKLAEEGLSYAPTSKSLRLLFTTLGGDPDSVPRKAVPPPAAAGAPSQPATSIGNAR
jgi:tetratricopeptide (TPR) repeat protein